MPWYPPFIGSGTKLRPKAKVPFPSEAKQKHHYAHTVVVDLAGTTAGYFKDASAGANKNSFIISNPRFYGISDTQDVLSIMSSEALLAAAIIRGNHSECPPGITVEIGITVSEAAKADAQLLKQRIESEAGSNLGSVSVVML